MRPRLFQPMLMKKRAPASAGARFVIMGNYFMIFGKVLTSASDTHWVTAASYAAF